MDGSLIQQVQESLLDLLDLTIKALPAIVLAIILLFVTSWAAKLTRQVVSNVGNRTIKNQSLRSLLVQLSYVSAWVVGILIASVVAFPDLRLGDIIGLLGLGSVAIGFAFQDIFKNFLAGILLLLQEPFRIGDQIVVEGYEGTVEEIAIRSTQIRTYQGELVVLPNAIVFTNPIQVLTAKPYRRTDLEIGLDYNTALSQAVNTLFEAVKSVEGVVNDPPPEVDIVAFGDSSIDFVVRYWTLPQKIHVRHVRTQAIIALKRACDRENLNIPYPIRTLYHFDQEKFTDYLPPGDRQQ